MQVQPIKITVGDYGFQQPFQLLNADGTIFNLTSCTAVINIQFAQTGAAKVSAGTIVIDTAVSGLCHYVPPVGTFDEWGNYTAQIVVTPSGGGQITFPGIQIVAEQSIPTV